MIWLIMIVTAVMMFLGFEMFLVLGIPSWLIQQAYYGNMPSVVLIQKMIAGIDNSVLMAIPFFIFAAELDRKSTRLNSSHIQKSRMPSSA